MQTKESIFVCIVIYTAKVYKYIGNSTSSDPIIYGVGFRCSKDSYFPSRYRDEDIFINHFYISIFQWERVRVFATNVVPCNKIVQNSSSGKNVGRIGVSLAAIIGPLEWNCRYAYLLWLVSVPVPAFVYASTCLSRSLSSCIHRSLSLSLSLDLCCLLWVFVWFCLVFARDENVIVFDDVYIYAIFIWIDQLIASERCTARNFYLFLLLN